MSAEVAVAYIYYNIGLILCCLDFIRNQYIEFIKKKESLRAIFKSYITHHSIDNTYLEVVRSYEWKL